MSTHAGWTVKRLLFAVLGLAIAGWAVYRGRADTDDPAAPRLDAANQ